MDNLKADHKFDLFKVLDLWLRSSNWSPVAQFQSTGFSNRSSKKQDQELYPKRSLDRIVGSSLEVPGSISNSWTVILFN